MNYRTTTLLALKALGTSGSEIIEINVKEKISHLTFYFKVTTGAADMVGDRYDAITKIEILDGSTKLLELTGCMLDAVAYYDTNKISGENIHNALSSDHIGQATVLFGRQMWDPLYSLDPTAFKNPQIRVTWDVTKCAAAATAFHLKVIADVFDEKEVTPVGFMRNNTVYVYTPTANVYQYVDLPTDLDIRKLIVQGRLVGQRTDKAIAEVKLSEDNDKRVPFDSTIDEIRRMNIALYPKIHQHFTTARTVPNAFMYGAPAMYEDVCCINATAILAMRVVVFYGGKFNLVSADDDSQIFGEYMGYLPYHSICFPFGDQNDPDDWYKTEPIGNLRLRIKNGATCSPGTVNSVILQQVYKY